MKTQLENPTGLHQRYYVQKLRVIPNPYFGIKSDSLYGKRRNTTTEFKIVKVPCKKNAEYFLLKLNNDCNDIEHIKACRIAVRAYAKAIKHHLPELAKDILAKYPLV